MNTSIENDAASSPVKQATTGSNNVDTPGTNHQQHNDQEDRSESTSTTEHSLSSSSQNDDYQPNRFANGT